MGRQLTPEEQEHARYMLQDSMQQVAYHFDIALDYLLVMADLCPMFGMDYYATWERLADDANRRYQQKFEQAFRGR